MAVLCSLATLVKARAISAAGSLRTTIWRPLSRCRSTCFSDPIRGLVEATVDGRRRVVEYEPDSELRDTEQVPLLGEGGIEGFLRREVLPYAPDAWYGPAGVKIGYEISFTRYFYKPQPMRTLEEIRADILAVERETEGLLAEIIGDGGK